MKKSLYRDFARHIRQVERDGIDRISFIFSSKNEWMTPDKEIPMGLVGCEFFLDEGGSVFWVYPMVKASEDYSFGSEGNSPETALECLALRLELDVGTDVARLLAEFARFWRGNILEIRREGSDAMPERMAQLKRMHENTE